METVLESADSSCVIETMQKDHNFENESNPAVPPASQSNNDTTCDTSKYSQIKLIAGPDDGQLQVHGLQPGQQLLRFPDGRLQIVNVPLFSQTKPVVVQTSLQKESKSQTLRTLRPAVTLPSVASVTPTFASSTSTTPSPSSQQSKSPILRTLRPAVTVASVSPITPMFAVPATFTSKVAASPSTTLSSSMPAVSVMTLATIEQHRKTPINPAAQKESCAKEISMGNSEKSLNPEQRVKKKSSVVSLLNVSPEIRPSVPEEDIHFFNFILAEMRHLDPKQSVLFKYKVHQELVLAQENNLK